MVELCELLDFRKKRLERWWEQAASSLRRKGLGAEVKLLKRRERKCLSLPIHLYGTKLRLSSLTSMRSFTPSIFQWPFSL